MKKRVYWVITFSIICLGACNESNPTESTITPIDRESNPANTLDTKGWPETFQIGREATEEEIAAKDIDVSPDGTGLPEGSGTVAVGRHVYLAKCAACHGQNGVEGPENVLVVDTTKKKSKAIGNYWPYATTLYDYINRAMPFNAPGSLSANEVYSLTAYLLFENKIIEEDKILTQDNLAKIKMPAQKQFVTDDRKGGPEVR